jgi:hypothetical protein
MADPPDNVDLQWIGKTLLAIQREQAAVRDELLVFGARLDRIEASIAVLTLEVRAVRNELARMNTRVMALEG